MHERRAKARVLVVEDSLTQAKKLEVILQSVGFEVAGGPRRAARDRGIPDRHLRPGAQRRH